MESFDFSFRSITEFLKYAVEILVLILIYKEIRELKKHQKSLEQHQEQLNIVRPFLSTLYSGQDEVMNLAINFVADSKEIYAMGSIRSLVETEIQPKESETDFNSRRQNVNTLILGYINATKEHILKGNKYVRVMDFIPRNTSDDSIFEILANVNFFLRLFEFGRTSSLSLELFHNHEILKERGDFHFRCSERQIILRAGGHGNPYTNAAIAITDSRVVYEYQQYFKSLIFSKVAKRIGLSELVHLRSLLADKNIKDIEDFLFTLSEVAIDKN